MRHGKENIKRQKDIYPAIKNDVVVQLFVVESTCQQTYWFNLFKCRKVHKNNKRQSFKSETAFLFFFLLFIFLHRVLSLNLTFLKFPHFNYYFTRPV